MRDTPTGRGGGWVIAQSAGLWGGKIGLEEKRLREQFVEYEAYARAVRFQIVPGLY